MTLRQFDPKNFEMILAGYPLEGYDLDFFSIQTDFDRYSLVQGIDGDAARVRNKLRSGTITIRLMQSSPSNNFLSYVSILDELSGVGVLPFVAKERGSGGTTIIAPSCFLTKIPDPSFSVNHQAREWRLRSDNIIVFLAGLSPTNGNSGTTLEDIWNSLNPVKDNNPLKNPTPPGF